VLEFLRTILFSVTICFVGRETTNKYIFQDENERRRVLLWIQEQIGKKKLMKKQSKNFKTEKCNIDPKTIEDFFR